MRPLIIGVLDQSDGSGVVCLIVGSTRSLFVVLSSRRNVSRHLWNRSHVMRSLRSRGTQNKHLFPCLKCRVESICSGCLCWCDLHLEAVSRKHGIFFTSHGHKKIPVSSSSSCLFCSRELICRRATHRLLYLPQPSNTAVRVQMGTVRRSLPESSNNSADHLVFPPSPHPRQTIKHTCPHTRLSHCSMEHSSPQV